MNWITPSDMSTHAKNIPRRMPSFSTRPHPIARGRPRRLSRAVDLAFQVRFTLRSRKDSRKADRDRLKSYPRTRRRHHRGPRSSHRSIDRGSSIATLRTRRVTQKRDGHLGKPLVLFKSPQFASQQGWYSISRPIVATRRRALGEPDPPTRRSAAASPGFLAGDCVWGRFCVSPVVVRSARGWFTRHHTPPRKPASQSRQAYETNRTNPTRNASSETHQGTPHRGHPFGFCHPGGIRQAGFWRGGKGKPLFGQGQAFFCNHSSRRGDAPSSTNLTRP